MWRLDPIPRGTMSSISPWPRPPRLDGEADSAKLVVQWHLRLAIACTEDGNATTLANHLGVTPATLHLATSRGRCTDDLAKRIEKLFGREYFPRELFVPEPELPVE